MLTVSIFAAAHWIGVGAYLGSLVFLLLIFQRVYGRYRDYKYIDNFRAEIVLIYWKFLHVSFIVILVSGAALAGLRGRSVLSGTYGLIFSTKLVLWVLQIYLAQEYLKPFIPQVPEYELPAKPNRGNSRPIAIIVLLLLISLCGFALKHL